MQLKPTKSPLLVVITILGVVFVAHFLFFPFFGLYDDNYFYTLPVMDWSKHDWAQQAWNAIIYPIQGRPLNSSLRTDPFSLPSTSGV